MKILAIDTSQRALTVALCCDAKVVAQEVQHNQMQHSIELVPAVERLMHHAGWQPQDLDRIAVAQGPGSYTGVRIGVTFAKTLAWTLGIELVGLSSMQLLAASRVAQQEATIVAMVDARRNNVYAGCYAVDAQGQWRIVCPDGHCDSQQLLRQLAAQNQPYIFVGPDVVQFREAITRIVGANGVVDVSVTATTPEALAQLAHRATPCDDVHVFVPEYRQLAEAEAQWLQQHPEAGGDQYVDTVSE